MPGASEHSAELHEFLNAFFAATNGTNRTTLEKYIELEKALLEQYQKYIADELTTNDDILQNFTKMMMTSCLQIVAFQRENRARFLELQSTMAGAHLRFLEKIGDSLSKVSQPRPAGESSDGQ